jgi:hypothetical protein
MAFVKKQNFHGKRNRNSNILCGPNHLSRQLSLVRTYRPFSGTCPSSIITGPYHTVLPPFGNLYLILKHRLLLPTFLSVLASGAHLLVSVSRFPHCTRSHPDGKGAAVGEGENGREAPLTSHRLPLLTGEEGTTRGEGLLERRGLKVARRYLLASALQSESCGPRGCAAPPSSLHVAVGEPRFAAPPSRLRATTRDQRAWGRAPSPSGLRRPRRRGGDSAATATRWGEIERWIDRRDEHTVEPLAVRGEDELDGRAEHRGAPRAARATASRRWRTGTTPQTPSSCAHHASWARRGT